MRKIVLLMIALTLAKTGYSQASFNRIDERLANEVASILLDEKLGVSSRLALDTALENTYCKGSAYQSILTKLTGSFTRVTPSDSRVFALFIQSDNLRFCMEEKVGDTGLARITVHFSFDSNRKLTGCSHTVDERSRSSSDDQETGLKK